MAAASTRPPAGVKARPIGVSAVRVCCVGFFMGMSFDGASYPVFGLPVPTPLALFFGIVRDNVSLSGVEKHHQKGALVLRLC